MLINYGPKLITSLVNISHIGIDGKEQIVETAWGACEKR
jgi:hypothetical protein